MSLKKSNAMNMSIIATSKRREAIGAAMDQMFLESSARIRQILLEHGSLEPFLGPDLSAKSELKSKR